MPSFVDQWTAPIPYQLLSCGEPLNLDGDTCVSLRAYGTGNVFMPMAGLVTITAATCGIVEFAPATCDLSQAGAEYRVRFRIRDAAGKVSFCPSEEAELWTVRRM